MIVFLKIVTSLVTLLGFFALWNIHCSTTKLKPAIGNHEAYIAVYPGHHNSLLLPTKDGWQEFSFGDWDIYAKSKINFWTGMKSMGLPSQGALGTRQFLGRQELPKGDGMSALIPIKVNRAEAEQLQVQLSQWVENHRSVGVFNPEKNLYFVKYPSRYAAWNTCNNVLIAWLNKMGVEAEGFGWAGNFTLNSKGV